MKEMVHKNKILEMVTGSHLYGTNTESSDIDQMGVFIPPIDYYFGLKKLDEVDLSIVSKDESGKNTSDAEDIKFYSLNKFVKLAMENNPNILSQLFVNENNILYKNDIGQQLLDIKHLFPWKGLSQKYIGYAISQMHKMHIKVSNYDSLIEAHKWLEEKMYVRGDETKYASSQLLAEFRSTGIPGVKFYDHFATIGDINISLTDKISKVYNKVVGRMSKVGNREELYTKYGYDVKFGTHLLRLLLEGKELLTTGNLEYPLKDREFLQDIRKGKYTAEEVTTLGRDMIKEVESLVETSKLPSKPRYDEIEQFLIRINIEFFKSSEVF